MVDGRSVLVGIRASGGPLLQTAVRLEPGLNVLYGVNGAGKTRLLHALHFALTGERENVFGAFDVAVELFTWLPDVSPATWGRDPLPGPHEIDPWPPLGWTVTDGQRDDLLAQVNATTVPVPARLGAEIPPAVGWIVIDGGADEPDVPAALVWLSPMSQMRTSWELRRTVTVTPGSAAEKVRDRENELLMLAAAAQDELDADVKANAWPDPETWSATEADAPPPGSARANLSSVAPHDPVLNTLPSWSDVRNSLLLDRQAGGVMDRTLPCLLPDDGLPVNVAGLLFTHANDPSPLVDLPLRMFSVITEGRSALDHLRHGLRIAAVTALGSEHIPADEELVVQKAAGDAWLADTASLANRLYSRLLLGAPSLEFRQSDQYVDSFTGDKLRVFADGRDLASLSHAQLRWANLAVALACQLTVRDRSDSGTVSHPGPIVILDEPEAALHRSAERQMAAALAAIADEFRCMVVVATHCPDLLDAAHAHVSHVRTSSDVRVYRRYVSESGIQGWQATSATRVTAMTGQDRADLDVLGLAPSDMLPLMKWVLLVEGHHERVIFNELFADVLAAQRAIVIAMDGGKKLANTVDSHFLWRFTDARIIPILDKIDPYDLDAVYAEAQHTFLADGPAAAHAVLARHLSGSGSGDVEPGWLREFLFGTLNRNVDHRVVPWGMSAADVLCTLPVTAFVSSRKIRSWQDLFDRYDQAKADPGWQRRQRKPDWKLWAVQTFGADFSDAAIVAACRNLTALPEELRGLKDVLETVT